MAVNAKVKDMPLTRRGKVDEFQRLSPSSPSAVWERRLGSERNKAAAPPSVHNAHRTLTLSKPPSHPCRPLTAEISAATRTGTAGAAGPCYWPCLHSPGRSVLLRRSWTHRASMGGSARQTQRVGRAVSRLRSLKHILTASACRIPSDRPLTVGRRQPQVPESSPTTACCGFCTRRPSSGSPWGAR